MHIFVKTITGLSCEVNAETLNDVKLEVFNKLGFPEEEQKLLLNGHVLSEGKLNLEENSELSLILSLEGGAKGKKKKKVTKTSKKKHHKKKVNLPILKYYKVEGEDKVVRLKQMCKVCPPGTFIAEHQDRLYCGRCRTAYTKVVESGKKQKEEGKKGKKGKDKK